MDSPIDIKEDLQIRVFPGLDGEHAIGKEREKCIETLETEFDLFVYLQKINTVPIKKIKPLH